MVVWAGRGHTYFLLSYTVGLVLVISFPTFQLLLKSPLYLLVFFLAPFSCLLSSVRLFISLSFTFSNSLSFSLFSVLLCMHHWLWTGNPNLQGKYPSVPFGMQPDDQGRRGGGVGGRKEKEKEKNGHKWGVKRNKQCSMHSAERL